MKTYTVLGIDPGILNTGLGIVKGNSDYKLIAAEHVKTDSDDTLGKRLADIQIAINEILTNQAVDVIAIEKCYHNKNVSSAASTQQVIGAAHIMAYALKIPVIELAPQQIKAASGFGGSANKAEMLKIASSMFKTKITSHHTADAALCALAGILQMRCPNGKK